MSGHVLSGRAVVSAMPFVAMTFGECCVQYCHITVVIHFRILEKLNGPAQLISYGELSWTVAEDARRGVLMISLL